MPPVATTTVSYTATGPGAAVRAGVTVSARLVGLGDRADDTVLVTGPITTITDAQGEFTLALIPNSAYQADGTYYLVSIAGGPSYSVVVPVSAVPVSLWDIRVDPTTLDPAEPPAPSIYLTRAELAAPDGVAPLGADGLVPAEHLPVAGGAIPAAVLDAKGDLVVATAADTPARLPVGADGLVLRADSGTSTGLAWGTLDVDDVTGLPEALAEKVDADTVTAAGDLLVASGASTVDRLPVGAEGQVLTVSGGTPAWAAAAGGGGALNPAKRLGMVAYTAPAWAISQNSPTTVALVSGRIYLSRMLVDDDPITDALLAHGAAGVGPGSVWLGVYEEAGTTLTRTAQTADVAATFTTGDARYKTAPLAAPVAAGSPRPVWHAVLSTLATGPSAYITHGGLNGPLANPVSVHVAALLDGQAGLPDTIDLTTTTENTAELIAGLA